MFPKNTFFLVAVIMLLVSCEAEENYPGTEYAPQMYHSVPYEPLSQFTEEDVDGVLETWYYNTIDKAPNSISTEYTNKKHLINSLEPVEGTIKRQKYSSVEELDSAGNRQLLLYNIDADDFETAGRILKNPVPKTDEVMQEGSALYGSFCSHCHGGGGAGDGKVGVVYKGVANLLGGAYKNLPEGHIFHVITHGKGRMWAHKSQLSPEERWKVVHYVKQLQGTK